MKGSADGSCARRGRSRRWIIRTSSRCIRPARRTASCSSPCASSPGAIFGGWSASRAPCRPGGPRRSCLPRRRRWTPRTPWGWCIVISSPRTCWWTRARAGQFLGTPDYSAPEQISGQNVDGRADQYALACVAYTLLTGTVPFERDHPMAVLYAHLHEPPPRVTAVRPELSTAVDQVLAVAMAKAPDDRYESCGAFADALRQALGVGPYGSPEPGRPATDIGVVPAGPGRQQTILETTMAAGGMPVTPALAPAATLTTSLSAPPDSAAPAPPVRAPSSLPDAASLPAAPGPSARPNAAGTWTAVVSADRAYYDSVQADSTPDAALIGFPDHFQERRFRLSGTEARIGRRSASRHTEPEIDLRGPDTDPGVSRLHAMLIAGPDGTWSVVDLGSPNGTIVNGSEVRQGEAVPLRHGDRINLGAWTAITMTRG